VPAPVLLIAPQGLTVTGVNTWIALVARGLADHDAGLNRPVGVLVHGSLAGHDEFDLELPEGARLYRRDDLPGLDTLQGDLAPIIWAYRDAARDLSWNDDRAQGPVVVVPSRHAECFAACAALTMVDPEGFRLLAVQQIDGPYESAIVSRYEPACAGLAGVSTRIVAQHRERFPERIDESFYVPNAADVPRTLPPRQPLADRLLRLLYTGRLDHEQKRVDALILLSDELGRRGVSHVLTLLGDGPAGPDIESAARGRPAVRRLGMVPPHEVAAELEHADILVMASRTEGLSLSLLEAMGHACVPVITDTPSGARDAIDDGVHGVLVPFAPADDDRTVAAALADGVQRAIDLGLEKLGAAAHERVRAFFSADRLTRVVAEVADRVAAAPPRSWPADRPVAFNAPAGGEGGSVPPGGRGRFAVALEGLAGKNVVIHGVGRHTRQLAELLADPPCTIVGFTDDDPKSHGSTLFNWPVVAPADAASLGPDAVLISSAMHEATVYERRALYESQGLTVHRVYADA